MRSAWAPIAVLFLAAFAAGEERELPIVGMIREVIYEGNQYLAKNHYDVLRLPDIGLFSWDPLKMRNGKLANMSTIELIGEPDVTQEDGEDGSTILKLNMTVGLGELYTTYDFYVRLFGFVRNGSLEVFTDEDEARVELEIALEAGAKCKASLKRVDITQFDSLRIIVKPDESVYVADLTAMLLDAVTWLIRPAVNEAINVVISTDIFQWFFQQQVCKNF